jgi:anti-sigma B factor antagonist
MREGSRSVDERAISGVTVLVTEHESMPVVAVSGEVDLHAVPGFRSAMQDAESGVGEEVSAMIVDLREVEFMDSSGLGVLIGHHRRLEERAGALRIVAGEAASKILRLTSLDAVFEIYDSREQAFAGRNEGYSQTAS